MVAPSISVTTQDAFYRRGLGTTDNIPNAPLYPGVVSATLSSTTTPALCLLNTGRAGTLTQAASYSAPVTEGGGWYFSQSSTTTTFDASNGVFVLPTSFPLLTAVDTAANNGIVFALRSGVGNWRRWAITGSNHTSFSLISFAGYEPVILDATCPGDFPDDGTFNPAAVDRLEVHVKRISNGSYTLRFDEAFFCSPISLLNGEVSNPATLKLIEDYFNLSTGTIRSIIFSRIGDGLYYSFVPLITIGDGTNVCYFNQETFGLRFPVPTATNKTVKVAAGRMGLRLLGGASSTIRMPNASIAGGGLTLQWKFETALNAGTTLNTNNLVLQGAGATTLDSDYSQSGGAIVGRNQVSNQGTLSDLTIRESLSTSAIALNTGTIENLQIRSNTGAGVAIDLNGSTSVDYSAKTATLRDNGTYDVLISNTGAGSGVTYSVDISGFTQPASNTTPTPIYVNDANVLNTYDITTNTTYDQLDASSAGATVNIIAPTDATVVAGIPEVANAILAVTDLTTEEVAYPALAGGGCELTLNPARNYLLAADAPGYLRQAATIPGTATFFQFDLANYRTLYDSGVSRSADIDFNYSTLAVTVSDGTANLTFADVFRTLEDYLSTEQGVLFPNPPYPVVVDLGTGVRNYLFFPYDTDTSMVNPVRIHVDPTNTSDPTLTDFVIVLQGATAPLFDIFDFTDGGGRIIRFQTDAVASNVSVSGGLSTEDRAVIDAIATRTLRVNGLIEDSSGDRFTTKALEAAPSSSGGGLDAAGVREAIGLASANLDTQLGAIATDVDSILVDTSVDLPTAIADVPTVAEFNARTLPSADYFNPATDGVALAAGEADAIASAVDSQLTDNFDAIPTASENAAAVRTNLATELGRIDANITSRSEFDPASDRVDIGFVSGIAVTNINDFKADVSGVPTDVDAALADNFTTLASAIAAIPTNPLLAPNYVAPNNAGITAIFNTVSALPTLANIEASTVLAREGTLTTLIPDGAITRIDTYAARRSKLEGFVSGVSGTFTAPVDESTPGSITTSDGDVDALIVQLPNGARRVQPNE